MPELRILIPESLEAKISAAQPDYLDRKGFVCLVLDQALDTVDRLPAYRVGAGHQGTEDRQPTPQQPSPLTGSGDSAPIEAVKASRKKIQTDRVVPQCVYHHSDLIEEFWRAKKGSRSETAWKLLMTELEKIQDVHGDERVDEQLRLAINGKWTGISLRNLERFEQGNARATPRKMTLTEEARSLGLI